MPLLKGKGGKVIGENIRKELLSGKSKEQSIAITLNTNRKFKKLKDPKKAALERLGAK